MKKKKHSSKSVDNDISCFSNNSYQKRNENKKTPRTTRKKNYQTTNNSSFILIQDKNKFIIEKNYTQQMPASNILEEIYIKYSKNLQKYFLQNQTGLKLAGNKYFQNLTVEEYIKQYNLTQEEFIQLLNGGVDHTIFTNNKNLENIKKEHFFLTPLPNKSRQLLNTNKEKSDFLEAERAAVVMRTFEYTHGIKSKVGIYEYRKFMMEQKQKLISLMLNAAQKIQRWWKKKYYYINKNRNDESFNKRLLVYNDILNRKKAKIFYDKINNYIKYKLKDYRKNFLKKLKHKAKNSMKKIYTIFDWNKNMEICNEIKLEIIDVKFNKHTIINKNYGFITNFFMTKKSFISKNNDKMGINTKDYQIKKIIFIQKIFKGLNKIQKDKKAIIYENKEQFSYYNPNKIMFLFNKSATSEARQSKSYSKNNKNNFIPRKYSFSLLNKNNNENKKNKILIEEEKTIKGNLPSLSPLSISASENDENDNKKDNINYLNYLNKKTISNNKKKEENNLENPNKNKNYTKINNNNNKNYNINDNKKKNKNKISCDKIKNNNNYNVINNNNNNTSRNNNVNIHNKNSKNKTENKKKDKIENGLNRINLNNKNNLSNKTINNENKDIPKEITEKKENIKNLKSNNIKNIHYIKNQNFGLINNKRESKTKKNNILPYNDLIQNKKSFVNSEFNFNSSSLINKQISFGVDNAPSEIVKKNNVNSFFDNDNFNNNSSINNYCNLNNDNEKNNNHKIKILANIGLPSKNSLINNVLSIEGNELNIINKKNKGDSKNNLLLIDSLEIENTKKIDKNIIKAINSNENFEKSLSPEINLDNYQQDSTLDYKDKKIKSNQKTISTSAILRLDTLNNQANHQDNVYTFQMIGQIGLNYLHRPAVIGNNYITKLRKKYFSSEYIKKLNNLLDIKKSFSSNKFYLNNKNKSIILKEYIKQWKNITDKSSKPFTYSKIITSISTIENNDKGEYFSYYCKINKSNQENDFVFLRISLGYKLLRQVFCGNNLKIFFYLLKKRRRKKYRAKTFLYKRYSNNIDNLLDFKIKLPIILNNIIIKKYFEVFYHKFLYYCLNLNDNIEYNLANNETCRFVREAYRKGYFKILNNILKIRFNYEYYNTGLKFGSFIKILFSLHE